MFLLAALGATTASLGWAVGIVLAQRPAGLLGAFEFVRIQLVACAALMGFLCTLLGYWPTVSWVHWPAFIASSSIGIVLGNLAMVACLRLGDPRRTELLLALMPVVVACMAFAWFDEHLTVNDFIGSTITLAGVFIAIAYNTPSEPKGAVESRSTTTKIVLLGLAAASCQGFGFLAIKPALVAGTEPMAATALRLLTAAMLVTLIGLWPSKKLKAQAALTPALLGWTILPGFIGYGVCSSLLLFALTHLEAGVATVLGSLSPVLVLPIVWIKDKQRPSNSAVFGAIIALVGTSIIFLF